MFNLAFVEHGYSSLRVHSSELHNNEGTSKNEMSINVVFVLLHYYKTACVKNRDKYKKAASFPIDFRNLHCERDGVS